MTDDKTSGDRLPTIMTGPDIFTVHTENVKYDNVPPKSLQVMLERSKGKGSLFLVMVDAVFEQTHVSGISRRIKGILPLKATTPEDASNEYSYIKSQISKKKYELILHTYGTADLKIL